MCKSEEYMREIQTARLFSAILFMLPVTLIHASDGQFEINQACAVNTGCFTGDAPGFPVTITQPGSYRLTGNLDLSSENANTHGIHVTAPATTVDLGGFRITGPASCSGNCSAITCSGGGLGVGVLLDVGALGSVARNGTVHNMGSTGIGVGAFDSRVEKITTFHNVQDGVGGDQRVTVINSTVFENGQDGIDVDSGSQVDTVTSSCNTNNGIEIDGINGMIVRSMATGNGLHGVNITAGGVVVENVTASGNVGNGINANGVASLVKGSVARGNNGSGYALNAASSKYQGNVSTGNGQSDVCGGGICTQHRRYYLTKTNHNGATALTACAAGFHMASLYEIIDTAVLRYDTSLGKKASGDTGLGPPHVFYGWIRTGSLPGGTGIGSANCLFWTSNASTELGTVVRTDSNWGTLQAIRISPWQSFVYSCDSLTNGVWCVEDD
jgi:hypothetical protein